MINNNTFEMILVRSIGHNDIKGVSSMRNTDTTLSEIEISINIR